MHRRLASLRQVALAWSVVLLAAACSSSAATWTFQPTPEATAQSSASPSASAAACAADDTVIKIDETATLKMDPATINVTAGKKVCFQVTNTAGFTHNFYVGPTGDIETRNKTAAVVGTPDFSSGTQTVEWTVTGTGPFEYGCWIAGHLEAGMKGSVAVK